MTFVFSIVLFVILYGKIEGANSTSNAVNPERAQLLKDALGWMTFRKNGVLMEGPDVESLFLETLMQKYTTSKFYRTFVIAFQQGVLPGLILQEGDPCDPDYTFLYKDPFNSSVTWHYQKKFTFKSHDDRMSGRGGQYCDYRQGLKCISSTRKCECPEGSKMQPISPTSQLRRCLMEKDEICALIDIDHGNDPSHSALATNLYHLIFNLEKPLSCRDGTQCRFKESNHNYPLCYENNNGPWFPSQPGVSIELGLGDECAIGLYAAPGSCKVKTVFEAGIVQGCVCYNFGPPRSIKYQNPGAENRTGFCFFEWGIYGVTDSTSLRRSSFFRPYFVVFVHPRTVPLQGADLVDFYRLYTPRFTNSFTFSGNIDVEAENEGDKCNVGKTQKMEQAWKYFASLEADPPPGEDYVMQATKTELFDNLETVVRDVANHSDANRKVCKVYWAVRLEFGQKEDQPALTCVSDNSTDADGNDGTCQLAGTETKELAEKINRFRETAYDIYVQLITEETDYRMDILRQNPELPCLPSLGPLPRRQLQHQEQSDILETLEGGYCPNNSICYRDFSDALGMYDNVNECDINPNVKQPFVCHDIYHSLETCEKFHLEKKITQVLKNLNEYEKLGWGQLCFHNLEMVLRRQVDALDNFNKYEVLAWIERGICDQKVEHLECTKNGTCECMDGYECDESISEPAPDDYGQGSSMADELLFSRSNGRSGIEYRGKRALVNFTVSSGESSRDNKGKAVALIIVAVTSVMVKVM